MGYLIRIGMLTILIGLSPPLLTAETPRITLATTTSTENSGLLSILLPAFEKMTGIHVDVIAVGTGAAIRLGETGDVDVVLVHAPEAEAAFVESGFGVNRLAVMHNDFVLLGPRDDPARVRSAGSAAEAFSRIAESQSTFVSRGDDSGTHQKELSIWRTASIQPDGRWYKEVGQGMGAVLVLSAEFGAYTISDRGTHLAMREWVGLDPLYEGDQALYNPYSIIAVNPAKHPHVKYHEAMKLIDWITSVNGQAVIREFGVGGERLFIPDAIP